MCAVMYAAPSVWAGELSDKSITISQAWVREAPPGASVHAAYMTITNHGTIDTDLVAVFSPAFENVMIHRTRLVDGQATMAHVDQVSLPAGASVQMSPGGMHVMLMGAKQMLSEGNTVEITLCFSEDIHLTIEVPVKKD